MCLFSVWNRDCALNSICIFSDCNFDSPLVGWFELKMQTILFACCAMFFFKNKQISVNNFY